MLVSNLPALPALAPLRVPKKIRTLPCSREYCVSAVCRGPELFSSLTVLHFPNSGANPLVTGPRRTAPAISSAVPELSAELSFHLA
jgi:hypothetical protein